jgi:hypothetical protein
MVEQFSPLSGAGRLGYRISRGRTMPGAELMVKLAVAELENRFQFALRLGW